MAASVWGDNGAIKGDSPGVIRCLLIAEKYQLWLVIYIFMILENNKYNLTNKKNCHYFIIQTYLEFIKNKVIYI